MKLLTTKDAAKILGVSDSRIRQLILSGKLHATKYGRDNLIRESDLEAVRIRARPGRPRRKS